MSDPKELDQAHLNAQELLEDAKTGVATEIRRWQVVCAQCERRGKPSSVIARFYRAVEDTTGESRIWVRVPGFKSGIGKRPASAAPVAWSPGEQAHTLNSQCSRCGSWWLVFPGGTSEAKLSESVGKTVVLSPRPGVSSASQFEVGDATVAGEITGERIAVRVASVTLTNKGGREFAATDVVVWIVRVDGAAWGTVVADA